jgi:photosystem II stability/assembly factor-like uncharacterized protein
MGIRQLLVALAVACLTGRAAFADGAFPDEASVMLPDDDPSRILVGTNFGLVVSPDAGASWRYVCEPFITGSIADVITFYKAGRDGSVVASSLFAFWRTTDGGCTWTRAGGSVSANVLARDLFIDPNDPLLVLAIATPLPNSTSDGIHRSTDGGRSFSGPVYTTANRLSGIEIARSNPNLAYASEVQDTPALAARAFLVRSIDRGVTWSPPQPLDVPSGTEVRIAAVDPVDANKVYLRLLNVAANSDSIALTSDGGQTVGVPLTIVGPTAFSTFLVAADGTLLAGTTSSDLYAAPSGTTTFAQRTGPRARCLGQRPGSPTAPIYACGDGFLDGYNLGVSDDGAQTFRPVMMFTQIAGPLTCPAVSQGCAAQFATLQQTLGVAPSPPGGGGTPGAAGKSGCGSAGSEGAALPGLVVAALGYLKLVRRRATNRVRGRQLHRT